MNFTAIAPDNHRSSWLFLAIHIENTLDGGSITKWQFGTGNANQLTKSWSQNGNGCTENGEILASLYELIEKHRADHSTLVIPSPDTVQCLRTCLLNSEEISTPSLHGINCICLSSVLDTNFENVCHSGVLPDLVTHLIRHPNILTESMWDQSNGEPLTPPALWDTRRQIGSLVPLRSLCGKPL
jgi:hypothetical protein